MALALLVTLRHEDQMRTFVFDESVQSVAWLGLDASVGDANALCCIESDNGLLKLKAVRGASIVRDAADEGYCDCVSLDHGKESIHYVACSLGMLTLHVRAATSGKRSFRRLRFGRDVEFEVGRAEGCDLRYAHGFVSMRHARIRVRSGTFTVWDLRSANGTYVNDRRILPGQPVELRPGDVVQVLDLTLCVGDSMACVNEPEEVVLNLAGAELMACDHGERGPSEDGEEVESAIFYPAPRLSKSIHPLSLQVDDPPPKQEEERQSALMQVGPSFLMGLSSVFMATSTIVRMAGGADVLSSAPSLAMAIAMVGGSLVWPLVSRAYTRKRNRREELVRTQTYVAYLDGIQDVVSETADQQAQILKETHRCVDELMNWAEQLSPLLMNRATTHEDFFVLRVGMGDDAARIDVSWPQSRFSLVEDPMLMRVGELARATPLLREVPITCNLATHWIVGLLGDRQRTWDFVRGLVVQVCALYSYQEVKVVVIGDKKERAEWDCLVSLGHFYAGGGDRRLVALTHAGLVELDQVIVQELEQRQEMRAELLGDYGTYYVVVCSNAVLSERSEALQRLVKLRRNVGFSLLYLGQDVHDLPRECSFLIDLRGTHEGVGRNARAGGACMFERSDVSGSLVRFEPDSFVSREQARRFALDLARARLGTRKGQALMPNSLGFLEVFEAGSVEHLNIGQRWVENDASHTLQARIGVDERGEPAFLDLHENIHGPHGLIAGTTGSGKSEFIITLVLSLCASYSPEEVAFVLIDYKGGGLAGAFCNERHQLPHLAGTITNLDGGAIRRSLVSIQSELRRRQELFNEARDLSGESTMDIYKYLALRRQGILESPLPHLVIVADEFAELKQQEPEFMDELVSAARIGRSLGIHLVLATQKPSGVVDDQIWSNSRFKIALKVADAADSREMIHRDDAAEIRRPGQYCMLIGYDESFAVGQAAYSGGPYVPTEHFERRTDRTVELLDAEGHVVLAQRPVVRTAGRRSAELDVVLDRIGDAARSLGVHARRLWLDPLPHRISLEEIRLRYGSSREGGLGCVIGVLDDPERQRQECFCVDVAALGNMLVCGSQSSDADGLLGAMLYSLISGYGPDELWVYGIDFGSGELASLEAAPQVGGVALVDDTERIQNLFALLEDELARRRKLASSRQTRALPHVVVVLANLASFCERFDELEGRLTALTRDAPRHGMHFIVSAPNAGAIRMRLRSNFGMVLPMALNDVSEYALLLGGVEKAPIPHGVRRGLARMGKRVLEFQGASIAASDEEEREMLARLADAGGKTCVPAPPIPVLPQHVTVLNMDGYGSGAQQVEGEGKKLAIPVGYFKASVTPAYFDLGKLGSMLVLGDDLDALAAYLLGVREALDLQGGASYCFVDPQHVLGPIRDSRVLQGEEEVRRFVTQLDEGMASQRIVVFTSIVQTLVGLPETEAHMLETYLAQERYVGSSALVVASELWRTKGLYQDWYKVVFAYGNGVWVGSGFADQTIFRYARSLPEYRQASEPNEGFCVVRGKVEAVRFIEENTEG